MENGPISLAAGLSDVSNSIHGTQKLSTRPFQVSTDARLDFHRRENRQKNACLSPTWQSSIRIYLALAEGTIGVPVQKSRTPKSPPVDSATGPLSTTRFRRCRRPGQGNMQRAVQMLAKSSNGSVTVRLHTPAPAGAPHCIHLQRGVTVHVPRTFTWAAHRAHALRGRQALAHARRDDDDTRRGGRRTPLLRRRLRRRRARTGRTARRRTVNERGHVEREHQAAARCGGQDAMDSATGGKGKGSFIGRCAGKDEPRSIHGRKMMFSMSKKHKPPPLRRYRARTPQSAEALLQARGHILLVPHFLAVHGPRLVARVPHLGHSGYLATQPLHPPGSVNTAGRKWGIEVEVMTKVWTKFGTQVVPQPFALVMIPA
ncbi:hypothetical protein GGX14DRAFT_392461 [Mycena pura]|uniref:Uncharacterized protein n=1 Tax=Mycena pura TaxID=153505 RepID=A0AAD6VJ58_9AGAR|nr:hypothetical protein GGX14DRAFT_392461 [Mycena pura]